MKVRRIVCATDFSTDASSALRRAVMLAAENGAKLQVLHVVARESLDAVRLWVGTPDFADRLVQALRAELDGCAGPAAREAGIEIETRVVVADVTDAILESAAAADLLVLGAHGTNPLKDAVIGTTALRTAGKSPTRTLVVRAPAERTYEHVLVAVDLLPGSEEAFAAALAVAPGAILTALHAYDVPYDGMLARAGVSESVIDEHRGRAHRDALEKIASLSRLASGDPKRFLAYVERGHPAARIVDRQKTLRADLVVIRKRARSRVESLLLGSVTRHVLADSTTDVLLLAESRG